MATKNSVKKRVPSSATYEPRPYTGILAEPPPYYIAFDARKLDPACPHPLFEGSREEWARFVVWAMELQVAHFARCLNGLADHYKIPTDDDGYNGWRLAMSLAFDHVPALQSGHHLARRRARRATSRGQPTRLDPVDTFRFLDDARQIIEREVVAGRKRPSDMAIGKELASREWARRLGLEPETIRKRLADVRNSFAAVAADQATEFQRQFVEIVFPIIRDAFHSSD